MNGRSSKRSGFNEPAEPPPLETDGIRTAIRVWLRAQDPQHPPGRPSRVLPIRCVRGTGPLSAVSASPRDPDQTPRAPHARVPELLKAALVAAPDRATWIGRRDHTLLLTATQTGLRNAELRSLGRCDVALGTGAHVRCHDEPGPQAQLVRQSLDSTPVSTVPNADPGVAPPSRRTRLRRRRRALASAPGPRRNWGRTCGLSN